MSKESKKFELDPESGSVSLGMLQLMHPAIVYMIAWSNLWCYQNGVKPMWTSWMRTAEQNKALGATTVHEWRGADLSLKSKYGWTDILRDEFESEINHKFTRYGALVDVGGELLPSPIVRHDVGHGDHFHLQVRP